MTGINNNYITANALIPSNYLGYLELKLEVFDSNSEALVEPFQIHLDNSADV